MWRPRNSKRKYVSRKGAGYPRCCFCYLESVYFNVAAEGTAGGRPFASLPSSLYGSGIAKQVFIARSRRCAASEKRKRDTRRAEGQRIEDGGRSGGAGGKGGQRRDKEPPA